MMMMMIMMMIVDDDEEEDQGMIILMMRIVARFDIILALSIPCITAIQLLSNCYSSSLSAMCFPTPRDSTTDIVNTLFNAHVNLSPTNKSAVVEKIIQAHTDFILFTDAALDSRVFALAHERLALYQGRVD